MRSQERGQHSHRRTELRDRALFRFTYRWLLRGIFLQTCALSPPHCTWSLTTLDSLGVAQWNTAEPRPSRQNKGQDFFRCWGQGVAWHASKDRVPRMPYPPNSGCIRHVLACPSSTPSECWRLPPRLESTPGLKLISLPLHNNAAASPLPEHLVSDCAEHALPCWAGPLSPRTQVIYPAKGPQHHPLCQV